MLAYLRSGSTCVTETVNTRRHARTAHHIWSPAYAYDMSPEAGDDVCSCCAAGSLFTTSAPPSFSLTSSRPVRFFKSLQNSSDESASP